MAAGVTMWRSLNLFPPSASTISSPWCLRLQVFLTNGGYSISQKEQQAIMATGGYVLGNCNVFSFSCVLAYVLL